MKYGFRFTPALFTLFLALFITAGCAKHAPVDEKTAPPPRSLTEAEMKQVVVARVNNVDLTMDNLAKMMAIIKAKKRAANAPESEEEIRSTALDQIIIREMVLQDGARRNIQVPKRELDQAMDRFVALQGHDEGFDDYLKEQNLTVEQVRARLEQSLLLRLMFKNEVISKISVTDDDIRKEYEKEKDQLVIPAEVSVMDIFIPHKDDKQAAMDKAEEILGYIAANKNKRLQISTKGAAFTIQHRDLDREKEPDLYNAAKSLQEGGYSGMVTADEGIHIVQLTKLTPEHQQSFDEAKNALQRKLTGLAQQKRIEEWTQELKKNAVIEILPESDVAAQEAKIRNQKPEDNSSPMESKKNSESEN